MSTDQLWLRRAILHAPAIPERRIAVSHKQKDQSEIYEVGNEVARRRRSSPPNRHKPQYSVLEPHAAGFMEQVERMRYTRHTWISYSKSIMRLAEYISENQIKLCSVDDEVIQRCAMRWGSAELYRQRCLRDYLRKTGVIREAVSKEPSGKFDDLEAAYRAYLRDLRGVKPPTMESHWRTGRHFLEFVFARGVSAIEYITIDHVQEFVTDRSKRSRRPGEIGTVPGGLNTFLYYLFFSGRTQRNLASIVPKAARRQGVSLPRYLHEEDIEKIIDAARSDLGKVRRRNLAIVLLLARLGLRGPEVRRLRLKDIDWRKSEIVISGKGDVISRLPMSEEVGKALADYIKYERMMVDAQEVFLARRPPYTEIIGVDSFNNVVRYLMDRAGVSRPDKHIGTHIFRHSLAFRMVRAGAGLEEIAQILRHRSLGVTLKYAKIDVDGLRSIARDWPIEVGHE